MAKYEKEQVITYTHKISISEKEFEELMKGYTVWTTIYGKNIGICKV